MKCQKRQPFQPNLSPTFSFLQQNAIQLDINRNVAQLLNFFAQTFNLRL